MRVVLQKKMGSGVFRSSSSPAILKCPDGFDAEKFRKICVLFDRLDACYRLGMTCNELTKIAELHVANRKRELRRRLESERAELERALTQIRVNSKKEAERAERESEYVSCAIRRKIEMYESLDEEGRERVFMRCLKRDQGDVDFWTFFEYMKTRTEDIGNVEW